MSECILEVNDLSIKYDLLMYRPRSLRDWFIQATSNPAKMFFQKREKHCVFDSISFKLCKGEKVGLLGINGTGKTSLCRAISGMYGKFPAIKLYGDVRAIFGLNFGIRPELTGRENVKLLVHLFFQNLSVEEHRALTDEIVAFSELGKFIDVPYQNYSDGMKGRLGLSLVSTKPSDLIVLDEVFVGADAFFSEKIERRFMTTLNNSGAVLFASHSVDLVRKVCNRVIVAGKQKILFDGDVEEGIKFYLTNGNQGCTQ